MSSFLRKLYEKNNNIIILEYIFLKTIFILFRKYKEISEEIKTAISNFEPDNLSEKEYKKIFRKLIVYRYIYHLRASEYYLYNFESNSYEDRQTFMTRNLTNKYYSVINSRIFRKVFDNKNLSYKVFNKYYKRDLICIKDKKDIAEFEKFIKNKKRFILKPFEGHSGDGIEIIDTNKFKNTKELFNYTMNKIPYVAEELINQSKELSCFHKQSVNTIRVVSFQYKDDVAILWAFLRTGQGNNEVDNMGAAGLGALIDPETGIIISDGYDWLGRTQECHPDSKIKFKGYQIPKWDELLEMVKNLSSEISQMHCVGWDLSLTDKGWVLVEANARPQCVTIQTFTKKGYRPYYDKMYILVSKEIEEQEKVMEMNL